MCVLWRLGSDWSPKGCSFLAPPTPSNPLSSLLPIALVATPPRASLMGLSISQESASIALHAHGHSHKWLSSHLILTAFLHHGQKSALPTLSPSRACREDQPGWAGLQGEDLHINKLPVSFCGLGKLSPRPLLTEQEGNCLCSH